MLTSFFKDSVIYTIPAIVSRGLALLLIPLYTRVLSPADYGALDLLLVFVSLVSLTVALEVSQGVARFYSDEPELSRRIDFSSSAFWFTVVSYTAFTLLATLYSRELADLLLGHDSSVEAFRIGLVYAWLNGVLYLVQSQFRWEFRSKQYAIVSLIVAFITASVAVYLTYGLRLGLEGMLWGMVAGSMSGLVYGLWNLRDSFRFRFNFSRLKEMLLFSAPLVPSGIAVFATAYIDRIMIHHYMSLDDVGLYGIGFRVASISALALLGFQGALTPLVYRYYQQAETPGQIARIFRVFIALALLIYAVITLWVQEILALITVPEYYGAASVVTYLVPAVLLSQMYIFFPGIAIAKKMYLVLIINLMGALLNVLFNYALIPALGIAGAALASLLGYMCVLAAHIFFSQRLYYVPYERRRTCLALLLILPLGLLPLSGLDALQQWMAKLTGLLLAVGLILMTGLINWAEVRQLKKMLGAKLSKVPTDS